MNSNHDAESDALDQWLKALPSEPPPVDLRGRCLATITMAKEHSSESPARNIKPFWTRRPVQFSAAAAAVAAALLTCWSLFPGTQSLFAQALHEMDQAPAVHIVTRISETRDPEKPTISEVWRLRGVGMSQTIKYNDEVIWQVIDDRKNHLRWRSEYPGGQARQR